MADGQVLHSQSEEWVAADQSGGVESVNGRTGVVTLVVSDLANDAGYITAAEAPVSLVTGDSRNYRILQRPDR